MFFPEHNRDFKIIIRPPSIEYSIPATQFLAIKHLSYSQVKELFVDSMFYDWQIVAIKSL